MNINPIVSRSELSRVIDSWKAENLTIGFVPTMGALHEGHLSLIWKALEVADRCVVSIFVNPTQFAPHEDFDAYPRDMEGDLKKLAAAGADLVYAPSEDEIYPDGIDTDIKAGETAEGLESDFRPHFFDGVVNVVSRLFDHVQPDWAVFGQKDFQQLMVIREMVETYNVPVKIFGAPIVRDEHGLALSSRNAYLGAKELEIARRLNKILFEIASATSLKHHDESQDPEKNAGSRIKSGMLTNGKNKLLQAGFDKVDYVEERWGRLLAAAWIGKTRLIDNVKI